MPEPDVSRELTDALGRVKIAIDTLRSRAEVALPLFRKHSKGDAKDIERILAELERLEPEVIRLLGRFDNKTDPTLWFLRKETQDQ